jgi:hypothetical protein
MESLENIRTISISVRLRKFGLKMMILKVKNGKSTRKLQPEKSMANPYASEKRKMYPNILLQKRVTTGRRIVCS